MRHVEAIAGILLAVLLAAVAPGQITIEGPEQVAVGAECRLKIQTPIDLDDSADIGDIKEMLADVEVWVGKAEVDYEWGFANGPDGLSLVLRVDVPTDKAGSLNTAVIIWAVKGFKQHAVVIGGTTPVPPTPEPGRRYLLFLHEKAPKRATSAEMLVAARWATFFSKIREAESKGELGEHPIKIADDDVNAAEYARFKAMRQNDDSTPTLFIVETDTPAAEILWHGPSPATVAEVKAKLADFGG